MCGRTLGFIEREAPAYEASGNLQAAADFFLVAAAAESSDRREIYFTTLTVMLRHWDSSAQEASELSSGGSLFKTASKAATIY